ncbi:MAG: FRG domain-containing protein [Acidobacteria bacterium]|nr:FRG domain-containing protein [Acidobacteriota bacterium]MYJ04220.1 FRG domain-containing protein [Acidobacteriota bacterium]
MDLDSEKSTAAQFHDEHQDSASVRLKTDNKGDYLHMKDPVVLATLIAFCSGDGHRIFLRGCRRDFPKCLPSIFRDKDESCSDPEKRWSAYKCILKKLRTQFDGTRWDEEDLGAVLQHYGIKTPWLDVVQNIHTAVWFATHKLDARNSSHRVVKPTTNEHGWIYLYVDRRAGRKLNVVDLRAAHSSQHTRPHVQQGLSLAMQGDPNDDGEFRLTADQDFITYQVARVRFPAQSRAGSCEVTCSHRSFCFHHPSTTTP